MRYNSIMDANPHDNGFRIKVEHIHREAPFAYDQLEKHLRRSPQLKNVVIDCVESIFKATL